MGRRTHIGLLILFAFLLSASLLYVLTGNRAVTYEMASMADRPDHSAEARILGDLRLRVPCEFLGELVERNGRPALHFRIRGDAEIEIQSVECLRSSAPAGYRVEKVT